MKNTIGEWYVDAQATHHTEVSDDVGEITVIENEWEDSLQVTQEMPRVQGIKDKRKLRRLLNDTMREMTVLESLGYDLELCDDGVAFWEREKE